jgi:hypothetical protein
MHIGVVKGLARDFFVSCRPGQGRENHREFGTFILASC